jgi:glutathionylspermidine synthase
MNPGWNRQQIIQASMNLLNPNDQENNVDVELRVLYNQLAEQKTVYNNHLQRYLQNRRERTPVPEVENRRNQLISQNISNRINDIGYAEGGPFSDLRNQVKRLFRTNIPDVHVFIARENVNEWVLGLD